MHGTAEGTVGPIEAKLLEYGKRDEPDAHAVVGFVMGAFGELSTTCYTLATAIARVHAARLMSYYHIDRAKAMGLAKQKIIRFWGLTAQHGWARLILDQRLGLVVSPAELPHATARDPGQDAFNHFIFFNPANGGNGVAHSAGFGPRNSDTGAGMPAA